MKQHDWLTKVYAAHDARELKQAYDDWASEYDQHLESMAWTAPEKTAQFVHQHIEASDAVLDMGCGTGLVGSALSSLGFQHIIGVDLSESMLREANSKHSYQQLIQQDLHQPWQLDDDQVDAMVTVGVLTYGHVQPSCLHEAHRATRHGGSWFLAVRPDAFDALGFDVMMEQFIQKKQCVHVGDSHQFKAMPLAEPEMDYVVKHYHVLKKI